MKALEDEFVYKSKNFKDRDIEIFVDKIESHRNGVSGEGFFVITFTDTEMKDKRFVGIVFHNLLKQDKDGYYSGGLLAKGFADEGWVNPQVAVLEIGMLNEGNIGRANKWRGDYYLHILVSAIVDHEKQMKKHDNNIYKREAEARGGI